MREIYNNNWNKIAKKIQLRPKTTDRERERETLKRRHDGSLKLLNGNTCSQQNACRTKQFAYRTKNKHAYAVSLLRLMAGFSITYAGEIKKLGRVP